MKMLYVSRPGSPEARLIIDGLNEMEDGPEEVFPIRLSDPAAYRALSAWLEAARANGVEQRVLDQAKDFLGKHSLYKAHYGVFPKQAPDIIKKETHKGYLPPNQLAPPPKPAAPPAPEAPKAPTLKPEIGEADGSAAGELLDAVKPLPKKRGHPGGPNKRRKMTNGRG